MTKSGEDHDHNTFNHHMAQLQNCDYKQFQI